MAVSKLAQVEKKFSEAQEALEAAANEVNSQLKELVKRAKNASAVDTGFVIAIASPVPEGAITHGSLAEAHRQFQTAVQNIEAIRREARQVNKEQEDAQKKTKKEEAPKAEAPAKKVAAKKPAAKTAKAK